MPLLDPHIVVREWARIPRSCVDMERLRDQLTIDNPAYKPGFAPKPEDKPYLRFWSEVPSDPGAVFVPRNYKLSKLPLRKELPIYYPPARYPHVDWDMDVPFTPRSQVQVDALEALSRPARYQSGRLLVLNAGRGKSAIAIRAAMTRPGPLLIVVDLHALVAQWRQRLKEMAGVDEEQVGFIQGKESTWRWRGYPVTIALMQTLMSKQWWELDPELRSYFATVVLDEVHVAGAQKLGRVVTMFEGERLGLTATPSRHDGQDATLHMHVARKACYTHLEQDLIPQIYLHYTGIEDPTTYIFGPGKPARMRWRTLASLREMDDKSRWKLAHGLHCWSASPEAIAEAAAGKRKTSYPATISTIAENRKRTKRISRFVRELHEDGRKVLVIGSRKEQLRLLHKLHPGSGLVLGDVKKAERTRQLYDFPVVYAEQSLVSKGLDRPEFDTLVVLQLDPKIVTKVQVPQSLGRIQRFLEGKPQPEAHYFIDSNSSLIQRAEASLMVQLRVLFRKALEVSVVRWR